MAVVARAALLGQRLWPYYVAVFAAVVALWQRVAGLCILPQAGGGERNTSTALILPQAGERTALATCLFATSLAKSSRIGRGDTAAAASR